MAPSTVLIWCISGFALRAVAAAGGLDPRAFALDEGACGDAPGCAGASLLQHKAHAPSGGVLARAAKDGSWDCPPSLCSTTIKPTALELVHEVYTYGAPATHGKPFRNAARSDECFPGLRSYTEDLLGLWGEIHQVDAAAINNRYPHAITNMVCLHWGEDSYYKPCAGKPGFYGKPAWPQRAGQVYDEWRLHQEDDYTDRLNAVTVDGKPMADEEPFRSAREFVLLAYKSYDTKNNTKKAIAQKMPGWRLVAKQVDVQGLDTDPVMIVQHNESLDCAIVFTGTNDFGEMTTSTTNYRTGYCGFHNVHVGYRNELWTISGHTFPKLRPTLEKCGRVICVGHSLGGALCEVFAACANSGNYTDPDYQRLAWTPGDRELMDEI